MGRALIGVSHKNKGSINPSDPAPFYEINELLEKRE